MSFNNISQSSSTDTSQYVGQDGTLTPGSWAHNSTTYTPVDSMTPITTNPSRKRSRDETAFTGEGENSYFSFPSAADVTTPAPIPEEPIYGEGMVLISPTTGRPMTAESQTGTWYEEQEARKKLEAEVAAIEQEAQFRPKMPTSRKSIRLSQSSIRANLDPTILANGISNAPASPPKSSSSDRTEVDEATLALGIGWTKLSSEDPDLQAAARGWSKYIENHYRQIHNAEILLKSRSLNAYLIGSQEGFYLFSDDLLEGKLVGRTWPVCLQNLKTVPMVFEHDEILRAERTPGPDTESGKQVEAAMRNWSDSNNVANDQTKVHANESTGMDLD